MVGRADCEGGGQTGDIVEGRKGGQMRQRTKERKRK